MKPGNKSQKKAFPGVLFPGMFPGFGLAVNVSPCRPLQKNELIYQ